MRRADVFLRGGKVFAVGLKGTGGVFFQDSNPAAADEADMASVARALRAALEASVIPSELPADLHTFRSALPALAGVKNLSAFDRGATMCSVRQHDDRFELAPGERMEGGAWRSRVSETLPASTSIDDLAAAVLRVLRR